MRALVRVWGLGLRLRVWGSGFRVLALGFWVLGWGLWVWGLVLRLMGLGFRVEAVVGLRFGFRGSTVERDKIRIHCGALSHEDAIALKQTLKP